MINKHVITIPSTCGERSPAASGSLRRMSAEDSPISATAVVVFTHAPSGARDSCTIHVHVLFVVSGCDYFLLLECVLFMFCLHPPYSSGSVVNSRREESTFNDRPAASPMLAQRPAATLLATSILRRVIYIYICTYKHTHVIYTYIYIYTHIYTQRSLRAVRLLF